MLIVRRQYCLNQEPFEPLPSVKEHERHTRSQFVPPAERPGAQQAFQSGVSNTLVHSRPLCATQLFAAVQLRTARCRSIRGFAGGGYAELSSNVRDRCTIELV